MVFLRFIAACRQCLRDEPKICLAYAWHSPLFGCFCFDCAVFAVGFLSHIRMKYVCFRCKTMKKISQKQ